MKYKNTLLVTGIILTSVLAGSFRYSDPPPTWKNLQVLPKDISKSALDSTMDHFSNSLKVTCGYCHVKDETTNTWDHANDKKSEKLMARDMIRLTDSINYKYFPTDQVGYKNIAVRVVSCYTCHHGEHMPASVAPASTPVQPKSPWNPGNK